jgi:hypothetical protein
VASPAPSEEINSELVAGPSSVLICGSSRSLLNWCALSLARRLDPEFRWTDARIREETLDPRDPLARGAIPDSQWRAVRPEAFRPNDEHANLAAVTIASVLRSDEAGRSLEGIAEMLRLPTPTQELIAEVPPHDRLTVFVLSNAHRLVAFYPGTTIRPILRTILDAGVTVVATWADAPPAGRTEFEFVLHVAGSSPEAWMDAEVRCEKGTDSGPFRTGDRRPLGELALLSEAVRAAFRPGAHS